MAEAAAKLAAERDSLAELFSGSSNFLERVPMLRVALDSAAAACTEELAAEVHESLILTLQALGSGTAGDLLDAHDGKSAVGVLHAEGWNARMFLCADRAAVFAITETMLGGDGSQPPYNEDRPLSRIETSIAGTVFQRLARALGAGFAGVADTSFALEEMVEEIDYDVIGHRNNAIVAAKFRLEAIGRGGEILLAVARAALNPLRQTLGKVPVKQPPPADPHWSQQMQNELTRAQVKLSAVLDERPGLLSEVANFKVGQIVELNATAHGRVRLECDGERLVWCHLGMSQGKYALRVDELIDREQELLSGALSG
jgi:flagellar motor switch protein FliM